MSDELPAKIIRLLNGTILSSHKPERFGATVEIMCSYIKHEQAPMFPRNFDAVLIRPQHFGLNNWNFQIEEGWNRLFDECVHEDFYHLIYGLFVFQAQPFLSATKWETEGVMHPIADAEIYYATKLPYFIPFSPSFLLRSESQLRFDARFSEAGIVRIVPIGVTVAKRHQLIYASAPLKKAIPNAKQNITPEKPEKQTKNKRVQALIENL